MKSIWSNRHRCPWRGKASIIFLTLVILVVPALLSLVAISPSTSADVAGLPIAESLSPLGSNLVRVWGFDAATQKFQLYDPAAASLSDLTKLKKGQGYWILVNQAQTVTLVNDSYNLSAGWNLIGWLGEAKVYQLQVSRHNTTTLDNIQADAILSVSTSVLQRNDGPDDVATFVEWVRNGEVTTFTTAGVRTDGIINGEADFNAVLALPGQVKVINAIFWCNGTFILSVLGCARISGTSIAVIRLASTIEEGILWDHEIGHNKGLNHREVADAVMYPSILPSNRKVNVSESAAYQR